MEKRLYKRIPVRLKAKIVLSGKTYEGYIINVSGGGIGYLIIYEIEVSKDFTPKTIVELNFQIPSDETLNLNCEIVWFSRTSPDDKKLILGMKITDPPLKYKEFIETLKKYWQD